MEPQDPKEKDLETPKKSKSDQGQGGNKVYINEIPLTTGVPERKKVNFSSLAHLEASNGVRKND